MPWQSGWVIHKLLYTNAFKRFDRELNLTWPFDQRAWTHWKPNTRPSSDGEALGQFAHFGLQFSAVWWAIHVELLSLRFALNFTLSFTLRFFVWSSKTSAPNWTRIMIERMWRKNMKILEKNSKTSKSGRPARLNFNKNIAGELNAACTIASRGGFGKRFRSSDRFFVFWNFQTEKVRTAHPVHFAALTASHLGQSPCY